VHLGHNALAGLSYTIFVIGLGWLQILTGLALYSETNPGGFWDRTWTTRGEPLRPKKWRVRGAGHRRLRPHLHSRRSTGAQLSNSAARSYRALTLRAVVRFYNKRGTAEQWIKEGKQAIKSK
jgi:hypothetical protein